jgi:hypothetical protein
MRSTLFWASTQHGMVVSTDVSGQAVSPIIIDQAVFLGLTDTFEDGTYRLSQNTGNKLPFKIPKEHSHHLRCSGSLRSHIHVTIFIKVFSTNLLCVLSVFLKRYLSL